MASTNVIIRLITAFSGDIIRSINQLINGIIRLINDIARLINGITRLINGWGAWLGPWGRRGGGGAAVEFSKSLFSRFMVKITSLLFTWNYQNHVQLCYVEFLRRSSLLHSVLVRCSLRMCRVYVAIWLMGYF